jgi:hypothetical protein
VVFLIRGSLPQGSPPPAATWSQDTPLVGGYAEQGDAFATSLAAGDFGGDGYADLAIGVPYEDIDTTPDAGCVNVLNGSVEGLVGDDELWSQDTLGLPDAAEADDLFGSALGVGDFDADGYADLAVGAPGEVVQTADGSLGEVTVLSGSQLGLTISGNQLWHQEVTGVPGVGGGSFGAALASVPRSHAFLFADDFERGTTSTWSAAVP